MARKRTWTDEQLRDAVATSTTHREVLCKLELTTGSSRHVQNKIVELELDTSHFKRSSRKECPDEKLRELASRATTCTQILQELGLELHSNNFYKLRRRIRELGIDTTRFVRGRDERGTPRRRWTDDQLRAAVASSYGYAQTIRALGLIPAGGNYDHVQRRVRELELDVSHFEGASKRFGGKPYRSTPLPLEQLLVKDRWTGSNDLKQRLLAAGLKTRTCELCGWAEMSADGRIPVELDHINGDKNDNRLENLRILCPNCHALQPTHRGLNQRKAVRRRKQLLASDPAKE